jgi:hypothetical protein
MNFFKYIFNRLIAFTVTLFLLCTAVISAADTEQIPDSVQAESVYTELHISPDGIYTVDSTGQKWDYDISRDRFEKGADSYSEEQDEKNQTVTVFGSKSRPKDTEPKSELLPESPKVEIDMPEDLVELELLLAENEKLEKEIKHLTGLKLGKVTIEEDEVVEGPIFAVGEIIVRGKVIGDVISYKRVTVTSTGTITGNATAPDIIKMRGGRIKGTRLETGLPQFPEITIITQENSYAALIANISIFAGLLIFGLLGIILAPKPINRVKECLSKSFLKSFILGLLFWLAFGPLFGLLCLTIIGIPVAVIGLPLATVLAVVLGIIGLSQLVGSILSAKFGIGGKSQLSNAIFGLFILDSFWLIMSLFFIRPTVTSQGFATLFLVLAIIIWSIGVSAGIGAVILTRLGSRDYKKPLGYGRPEGDSPPPPPTPPPLSRNSGI